MNNDKICNHRFNYNFNGTIKDIVGVVALEKYPGDIVRASVQCMKCNKLCHPRVPTKLFDEAIRESKNSSSKE